MTNYIHYLHLYASVTSNINIKNKFLFPEKYFSPLSLCYILWYVFAVPCSFFYGYMVLYFL